MRRALCHKRSTGSPTDVCVFQASDKKWAIVCADRPKWLGSTSVNGGFFSRKNVQSLGISAFRASENVSINQQDLGDTGYNGQKVPNGTF